MDPEHAITVSVAPVVGGAGDGRALLGIFRDPDGDIIGMAIAPIVPHACDTCGRIPGADEHVMLHADRTMECSRCLDARDG